MVPIVSVAGTPYSGSAEVGDSVSVPVLPSVVLPVAVVVLVPVEVSPVVESLPPIVSSPLSGQPESASVIITAEAARASRPSRCSSAPQCGQVEVSDLMCSRQAGQA